MKTHAIYFENGEIEPLYRWPGLEIEKAWNLAERIAAENPRKRVEIWEKEGKDPVYMLMGWVEFTEEGLITHLTA